MLVFEIVFLVVAALMLAVDIIFLLSIFFQDHGKVKSGEERNGNIGRNRKEQRIHDFFKNIFGCAGTRRIGAISNGHCRKKGG